MCSFTKNVINNISLMAQTLYSEVEDITNQDPDQDVISIHSDSEPPPPVKESEEIYQIVAAWRLDDYFKPVDSCQKNPRSDQPNMCLNGDNSVIVIQDDTNVEESCPKTEPNVITVSDSESECGSLPDIEPFDFDPQLEWPPPLLPARNPTRVSPHPEAKEQNFIYISEDSLDLDSFASTSNDEDLETDFSDFGNAFDEGPVKDLEKGSPVSIQSSHCKNDNSRFGDSGNNFIIDTCKQISTNRDTSALQTEPCAPKTFLHVSQFVLPYTLQPYASDANLGVEDLKDQPQVTIELIQACLEEGTQFALCSANISCHYLYAYRPTRHSLENLLTWLLQRDVGFMPENGDLLQLPYFKLYGLLNELFHCYPENVLILWDALCERMLALPLNENAFLDFAVTLEIYLSVLEGELFRLQDPKKSQAYRLLANNENYSNTKKIIQCLNDVVMILVDKNVTLAEQVMCQLEKLLELSVVVSSDNGVMAKRIAKDLVGVYLSIPYMRYRLRFLSTIQSDLIRFKFLEILLEKYCGDTMLSWSYMPESIADIAKSFFQAIPMKTNLLDDCIVIDLDGLDSMSPSRIEELITMIYFAIVSYTPCLQGSFYHSSDAPDSNMFCSIEPLSNGCIPPPWCKKLDQLKDLRLYISQLNQHVKSFGVELSEGSYLYLMMLDHLTDLIDEDVTLSAF